MRILQSTVPKIPVAIETIQESSSEKATAKQNQNDVFETVTSAKQEAAMLKREKSEVDAAIENVKALIPPVIGSPIGTQLSMGTNDRADLVKEAAEDLRNSDDLSQESALALQKRMQELTKAEEDKSKVSALFDALANKMIGNFRG